MGSDTTDTEEGLSLHERKKEAFQNLIKVIEELKNRIPDQFNNQELVRRQYGAGFPDVTPQELCESLGALIIYIKATNFIDDKEFVDEINALAERFEYFRKNTLMYFNIRQHKESVFYEFDFLIRHTRQVLSNKCVSLITREDQRAVNEIKKKNSVS